jgi:arginyl-tRNA synthetase
MNKSRVSVRLSEPCILAEKERLLEHESSGLRLDDVLAGSAFLVDFGDPNLNKALHVGHLRNLVLGSSYSALLHSLGATVTTQSIVCDTGRSMFEAMAGYQLYYPDLDTDSEKFDHRLGECYARFVRAHANPTAVCHIADAPLARELDMHDDLAEQILNLVDQEEKQTIELARVLSNKVLSAHVHTLRRLGIPIERIVRESYHIGQCKALLRAGLAEKVFWQDTDGRICYITGRRDYPVVPLTREDGFPTEHLRAVAVWKELKDELCRYDGCFHVMGREWLTSTEIRAEMIDLLAGSGSLGNYIKMPYEMVRYNGETMKSSRGSTILIDDLLDQLENSQEIEDIHEQSSRKMSKNYISRLIIHSFFLRIPASLEIDFSLAELYDRARMPGWIIASVLAKSISFIGEHSSGETCSPRLERHLTVMAPFVRRYAYNSFIEQDPKILFDFIFHLSREYATLVETAGVARLLSKVLLAALSALGLPLQQQNDEQVYAVNP